MVAVDMPMSIGQMVTVFDLTEESRIMEIMVADP